MTKNIDEIKNEIHKINPQITDELLDLLYEYIATRFKNEHSYDKMLDKLKNDEYFGKVIKSIILNN